MRLDNGKNIFAIIREEWVFYGKDWTTPGFRAMTAYRFGQWARVRRPAIRRPALWFYRRLHRFIRNYYGIEIHLGAKIGRRCRIVHQHGITIHTYAVIGDDCHISHMVTIGAVSSEQNRPIIGNRVHLGVGAVIVGNVTVGDGARIGPNAVVMKDIPPGASAVGNPARVIPGLASLGEAKATGSLNQRIDKTQFQNKK